MTNPARIPLRVAVMSASGFLSVAAIATAQAPLFASDSLIAITIETDVRSLIWDAGEERDEHPAILRYRDGDDVVSMDVELRVRGRSRRDPRVCSFPPLRFEWNPDSTAHTLFAGQHRLKLVTHCRNRHRNEQYVLHEYLIYKLYHHLTDISFRVRLARITYHDIAGNESPNTRFGFFVESDDALVARFDGEEVETLGAHPDLIEYGQMRLFDVFQYFIGNTDWGVSSLQNLIVFRADSQYWLSPYDFDHAGVINTPYATPDPRLRLQRVTQRLFRGFCRPPEMLQPVFDRFVREKDALYGLYRDFPWLDDDVKRRSLAFYDEFYEIIADPSRVRREFEDKCRT